MKIYWINLKNIGKNIWDIRMINYDYYKKYACQTYLKKWYVL